MWCVRVCECVCVCMCVCMCVIQSVVSQSTDNGIIVIFVHVLFLPTFFPLCVQESAEATSSGSHEGDPLTSATPTLFVPSAGMVI